MKSKIDYKELEKLIALLEEKNLAQFELELEDFKIKISRCEPQSPAPTFASLPILSAQSEETQKESVTESAQEETDNSLFYVTSPMVGTFYRAPDPSSPPFVEKGDSVSKNQTLSIIEAMKLMNEIESDIDGVIDDIFVENGNPVEYGQKLFSIKPL